MMSIDAVAPDATLRRTLMSSATFERVKVSMETKMLVTPVASWRRAPTYYVTWGRTADH